MASRTLDIFPIDLEKLRSRDYLERVVYPDIGREYYWSRDFSFSFYIAQAKAGFMAISETIDGEELLLPEMQRSYALLEVRDVHIGKKVAKVIRRDMPKLHFSYSLEEVGREIQAQHKNSWLTPKYLCTLQECYGKVPDFLPVAAYLKGESGKPAAGEIGYYIGSTYTSLTGFSSRERRYRDYGKVQMVLLAKALQEDGIRLWNLGHPYMPYKTALGAKIYSREAFLQRWYHEALGLDI